MLKKAQSVHSAEIRPSARQKSSPSLARRCCGILSWMLPTFHRPLNSIISARAVCDALDIELVEPEGWVCCGSSAAHRIDPEAATQLPMENLALIEKAGFKKSPCRVLPVLTATRRPNMRSGRMTQHKSRLRWNHRICYQDSVEVNTLTESILKNVGTEGVKRNVSTSRCPACVSSLTMAVY